MGKTAGYARDYRARRKANNGAPLGKGRGAAYDDFEDFAARRGYGMSALGEPALHKSNSSVSGAARRRQLAQVRQQGEDWAARRAELRGEFESGLASGRYRLRSGTARLSRAARGHQDNEATQAARRVLEKRQARMRAMRGA